MNSNSENNVNEPTVNYQSKPKLAFYTDEKDMEQSRINYNQQTSALVRIKNCVELINRIYAHSEDSNKNHNKKLYFK